MFEKNAGLQALIQYADVATAVAAKEALEGHCIYEGGFCKLHLSYSRHTDLNVKANNDWSRDYTSPNPGLIQNQPSVLGQQPSAGSSFVPTAGGPASPVNYAQLMGVPPPPMVGGNAQYQGWKYDPPQMTAGPGVGSMPNVSVSGPVPNAMYGSPLPPSGSAVSPGFSHSVVSSYVPSGLPPVAQSLETMGSAANQRAAGPISSSHFGHPPPNHTLQPFGQHQPLQMPGPGPMPPNSGPSAFYM